MRSDALNQRLTALFSELVYGAPVTGAYVLNRGDAGLLDSLERLSAGDASNSRAGGASIAAHVRHPAYGLSLLNRWAAGESPFEDANYAAAWEQQVVNDDDWSELRRQLRDEIDAWYVVLKSPIEAM